MEKNSSWKCEWRFLAWLSAANLFYSLSFFISIPSCRFYFLEEKYSEDFKWLLKSFGFSFRSSHSFYWNYISFDDASQRREIFQRILRSLSLYKQWPFKRTITWTSNPVKGCGDEEYKKRCFLIKLIYYYVLKKSFVSSSFYFIRVDLRLGALYFLSLVNVHFFFHAAITFGFF